MVFILLCDQGRQGEALIPMSHDHLLVFLAVWVLFFKFLVNLRSAFYQNCIKS